MIAVDCQFKFHENDLGVKFSEKSIPVAAKKNLHQTKKSAFSMDGIASLQFGLPTLTANKHIVYCVAFLYE